MESPSLGSRHPWFPARLEGRRSLWKPGSRERVASPAAFVLLVSGWVNCQQQAVINYLFEENRVLRAERGSSRLRLTDDQRRRLTEAWMTQTARKLTDARTASFAGCATSSPPGTPSTLPPSGTCSEIAA